MSQIEVTFSPEEHDKFKAWKHAQQLIRKHRTQPAGPQASIQLPPSAIQQLRQWQAEQRAKLAELQAADREPWEQDPDAWKGE